MAQENTQCPVTENRITLAGFPSKILTEFCEKSAKENVTECLFASITLSTQLLGVGSLN